MYNFDKVIDRRGTDSDKWDTIKKTYGKDDLLPMWVADMDFEILPEIIEAVSKRASHPTYGYTDPGDDFYESIIAWNKKKNNYDIKREWMLLSPGVMPAVKASVYAFTNPGDKVLIMTPVYPPFHATVNGAKRELVTSTLLFNGSKYVIDFDDLETKIKSGVKVLIMSSPHNPIGRVWTKDELSRIVDICYDNNVKIVSDEIHSDIIYKDNEHHIIFTVSDKARDVSVMCAAPSKTFNIAGLYASFVVVENEVLRKKLKESMQSIGIGSLNLFGQTACKAAYTYGDVWAMEMVEYVEKNADFVCEYVKKNLPGVMTFKPEGTYLMWLDFTSYGLKQSELMEKLVYEAGVVLNDGTTFGEEGNGFVRLNIGCPLSQVKECMDRIAKTFK